MPKQQPQSATIFRGLPLTFSRQTENETEQMVRENVSG